MACEPGDDIHSVGVTQSITNEWNARESICEECQATANTIGYWKKLETEVFSENKNHLPTQAFLWYKIGTLLCTCCGICVLSQHSLTWLQSSCSDTLGCGQGGSTEAEPFSESRFKTSLHTAWWGICFFSRLYKRRLNESPFAFKFCPFKKTCRILKNGRSFLESGNGTRELFIIPVYFCNSWYVAIYSASVHVL